MLKRTIQVMLTLLAAIFLTTNAEATNNHSTDEPFQALTTIPAFGADELNYKARNVDSIGNGEGRPTVQVYSTDSASENSNKTSRKPKSNKWLIYWYVCGTDIESARIEWDETASDFENGKVVVPKDSLKPGDITLCIREIEKADFSSGKVTMLVQAGGTYLWGHESFQELNAGVTVETKETPEGDKRLSINLLRPGKIGRYVYDKSTAKSKMWKPDALIPITATPESADETAMGSKECLKKFLQYGKEMEQKLYPDGKVIRAFIFVDHGGGSLVGVCQDSYTNDKKTLSIKDIRDAFSEVWNPSTEEPPFELVAFDTCLMSTYETAVALKGTARYMVASQEVINGKNMFEYTGFLSRLSKKPQINGAELGRIICDTYRDGASYTDKIYDLYTQSMLTMSVTDLSQIQGLETAYENFGRAALEYAREYPNSIRGQFSGAALKTERYNRGENEKNISQIVDLKHLAFNVKNSERPFRSQDLLNASNELIKAIEKAVIYNEIRGDTLSNGGGLSTFYPLKVYRTQIESYADLADSNLAPKSQSEFYNLILEKAPEKSSGNLPSDNLSDETEPDVAPQSTSSSLPSDTNASSGTNAVNPSQPQEGVEFDLSDLEDVEIKVDKGTNTASIQLTQEQMDRVAGVRCQLIQIILKDNFDIHMILLGNDSAVKADWNSGTFESVFDGKWIHIEDQPVFVYLLSESTKLDENGKKISGSELYAVPVELNNRRSRVLLSCKYGKGKEPEFKVIGVSPETNSEIPTGDLVGIKRGDVVKPICPTATVSLEKIYEAWEELVKKYPELEEIYYVMDPEKEQAFLINWIKGLSSEEQEQVVEDFNEWAKKIQSQEIIKFEWHTRDPFTVGDKFLKVKPQSLRGSDYIYDFEFVNPVNEENVYTRTGAIFTMKDGKVTNVYDGLILNRLFKLYCQKRKALEKTNE